jgi:hypothetical protein
MIARRVLLLFALFAAACGGPQGPDGNDIPNIPAGANGRNLEQPPFTGLAQFIELVRAQKAAAPGEQRGAVEVTMTNGTVRVEWERTDDGCRITIRSEGNPAIVIVVRRKTPANAPAGGPTVEDITVTGAGAARERWGPDRTFYATVPGCTDAVWLQYFERRTRYFAADGTELAPSNHGPELDEQNPYRIQAQPTAGSTLMQDDPGPNATTGTTAQAAAPGALAGIKTMDGVTNNAPKAIVVWRFWSYLICENPRPRRVLGHLAWGFTLTIDVNNDPYIRASDHTGPTWNPQPQ